MLAEEQQSNPPGQGSNFPSRTSETKKSGLFAGFCSLKSGSQRTGRGRTTASPVQTRRLVNRKFVWIPSESGLHDRKLHLFSVLKAVEHFYHPGNAVSPLLAQTPFSSFSEPASVLGSNQPELCFAKSTSFDLQHVNQGELHRFTFIYVPFMSS